MDTKQTQTAKLGKLEDNPVGRLRTISVGSEDYRDMDFDDTKAFIICESGLY